MTPLSHFSGSMGLSKERRNEIFGKKESNDEENIISEAADGLQKVADLLHNPLQPNQQS